MCVEVQIFILAGFGEGEKATSMPPSLIYEHPNWVSSGGETDRCGCCIVYRVTFRRGAVEGAKLK